MARLDRAIPPAHVHAPNKSDQLMPTDNDSLGQISGDTVRFVRVLPAPAALVWDYLTNSQLLPEWLGNGEITLEIGGRIELRSGGPVIRGKVLACEPLRLLTYTWLPIIPGEETPMAAESTLSFVLEARGDGTQLVLIQAPIAPEYVSRSAAGWHGLLDLLAAQIAGEPPPDFVDTFHRVLPEYERLAADVS